jgi:pimeloyl-ACP methyl ester carboxylesterase
VGHSYGALVALELAKDWPACVRSVSLLEPAAPGVSSSEHVVAALQPVIAAYRAGDREAAVDGFLKTVGGDDYENPTAIAEGLRGFFAQHPIGSPR